MADSFFGFNTSLNANLDEGLDSPLEDDDYFEEDKYDALNDETFGDEAIGGDWEEDHEKLAQIAESSKKPGFLSDHSEVQNESTFDKSSDSEIDVESTLSHLVIDDKDITIPKPGVWDSPTNLALPPPKPLMTSALKNACTVEELERGLITNRPPPGLTKNNVQQLQPPSTSSGNLFFNTTGPPDKMQHINGSGPPLLPHQLRMAFQKTNNRFPLQPSMFPLQNVRPMPNQMTNMLRFPVPPPHLLLPPNGQRPPHHGNFPLNNFPGPLGFLRPDHPLLSHYNNHQHLPQQNLHNSHHQHKIDNSDRHDSSRPFFRNNQHYQHSPNQNSKFFHNNNQHQNQGANGLGHNNPDHDEYAGLMNAREKHWLNNIQLLQLNTNQPYIDDFYYTVYCERLNNKSDKTNSKKQFNNVNKRQSNGKGNNSNNNNNNYHRDSRDRDQQQHNFTKGANTPMQFENSLGKLQYSSVIAPRKIIDMDVVPNSDPSQAQPLKDTKRSRQLLLEIERLYILLLKLEDRSNPLAIIAEVQREQQQREQQQQQREAGEEVVEIEKKDPIKLKEELTTTIMNSLLQCIKEDKFASLLSIRKGKTLFLRFLSCLNVKVYQNQIVQLWMAVIRGLMIIGRRDSHVLTSFYMEFRRLITETNLDQMLLLDLSKSFMPPIGQEQQKNNVMFALTNKFGISIITLMIKHGVEIFSEHEFTPLKWTEFLKMVGECIISTTPSVAPCETIDAHLLRKHLVQNSIDESVRDTFHLYFTEVNSSSR